MNIYLWIAVGLAFCGICFAIMDALVADAPEAEEYEDERGFTFTHPEDRERYQRRRK